MEYYSAIKKWNSAVCNNMDEPRVYYAEWNKSDRERQTLYDITYMRNLKKYNKLVTITKKQQTHRYREQTSGYHWGEGSGGQYRRRGLSGTNY